MHQYTYTISLRVKHPSADLCYLGALLEIKPEREWKVGNKRETPKGTSLEGTYSESYWYSVITNEKEKSETISMENSLTVWTEKLESYKEEFSKIITEGGSIEYFIWLDCEKNLGFELTPVLLRKISNLGISLGIVCDP